MSGLIQIPDEGGMDPAFAHYYSWGTVELSSGQFVIISCPVSGRTYFGQIVAPQLNFNQDGLPVLGNQTANLLQAISGERIKRDVGVKEVFWYTVKFLQDISTGQAQSVRMRPQIGASGRPATEAEIIHHLGLPTIDEAYRLGSIIDTQVAVCVDARMLFHQTLVAGSVGSGKSNDVGNIIKAGQNLGMHVIVYDHKPDYQHVHVPNDESLPPAPWYVGLPNVAYWYLGGKARHERERAITVPASELDPAVLAATLFYQPNEYNQAETSEMLLSLFADEMAESQVSWALADFFHWLPKTLQELNDKHDLEVNSRTYSAMRAKIRRPARVPGWIDGKGSRVSRMGLGLADFSLEKEVGPGRITVIRIDSSVNHGRGYGLFLSYLLKEAYRLREQRRCACPILHVIDEAQDIFGAGRTFQQAVGSMLDDNIRKGRSLKIGFVIGVQSAEAVPENLRNLMNTQFIHRHNNHSQAKEAMARATPAQIAMTDTFGPGECLASIFGANAVIHAQMRRSPFKLTKDND